MSYEHTISCCLCSESHKQTIELPAGWSSRYDGSDDELGFCPAHKKIKEFADSQCPGCVGGWGSCSLFSAFAYRKQDLSEDDFQAIERGVCPKRVNGTMSFSAQEGVRRIDLSEQAPTESGQALAQAIRDYWERYPHD